MSRRILIVRRENIGDLILTTPLIRALRTAMPDAFIAALVNSYNAPILASNNDVDVVYVYHKGKHADSWQAFVRARLAQAMQLWQLRKQKFDDVLLPDPRYSARNIRMAKFILAGRPNTRTIGFEESENGNRAGLDMAISKANTDLWHQAQYMYLAAAAFGISADPRDTPRCVLVPQKIDASITINQSASVGPIIGLHISARKPSQRWPAAAFVELATLLHQHHRARIKLFWSPGHDDDLLHPGDDGKAEVILAGVDANIDLVPVPTTTLRTLIDAMAMVDLVVCADGGALHVAAGLGKPIVALFGDSEVKRWHPWGVPYRAIQKSSNTVMDISPIEVLAAVDELIDHAAAK